MLDYFWMSVAVLTIVAQIMIVVILVRKFLRTRDTAFIWLGVATLVWPLASAFLNSGERTLVDQSAKGHPLGVFPFSLVEHGHSTYGTLLESFSFTHALIGAALLLIAVLQLSKSRNVAPAIQ